MSALTTAVGLFGGMAAATEPMVVVGPALGQSIPAQTEAAPPLLAAPVPGAAMTPAPAPASFAPPAAFAIQPATFAPRGGVIAPILPPAEQAPVLQPTGYSLDRRAPLDARIAAMPADYQKLEVILHRSQLVIARQAVLRFAITDPSVIEIVQYSPTEFAIIGNGLGTTDLMIWFQDQPEPLMYLVTCIPDPSLEDRRRIDFGRIERKLALLYPNSKVYLIPMSRKIIVRGQARDPEECARIMQVVRDEALTQDGALFAGYAGGVNGVVPANYNAANVNDYLSSFIVNELRVPGDFQIQVRVRIAELNRSMLREYGINWNQIVQISGNQLAYGANLGGSNILSFTGVFDDFTINAAINALASNGTLKIMEDASLCTMSGVPAAFLSGGEFAVPSTVGLQGVAVGTTTFRGFGTSVIATPTIIDHDLIRIQIVPELSSINGGNTVGGIPGVNVRRVQTQVELREGQTMVLGGLFSRQQQVEQTRIPLLGELPIVGPMLFSNKKATEDEIEMLIVVTPEIVRPVDPDQQPPLPGWYVTHPDDVDFYKLNRTEGSPNLGHYQLLPYGNGQGYAQDVGYNYYNPAPAPGPIGPAPTAQYGMAAPAQGYPPAGYGAAGYGAAPGFTPAPGGTGNPLMPQPQFGAPMSPMMGTPMPAPAPEPTPADVSRARYYRGGVQQAGAVGYPPARVNPNVRR